MVEKLGYNGEKDANLGDKDVVADVDVVRDHRPGGLG